MKNNNVLSIFDFDKTLIRKDSFRIFGLLASEKIWKKVLVLFLALCSKAGLISNKSYKAWVLRIVWLTKDERERERLLLGETKLRPEIKELFPHLKMHIKVFELLSIFGAHRYLSRAKWFVLPLFRMSNYLDWLEDSERPDFPVNAGQPSFLKNRFI